MAKKKNQKVYSFNIDHDDEKYAPLTNFLEEVDKGQRAYIIRQVLLKHVLENGGNANLLSIQTPQGGMQQQQQQQQMYYQQQQQPYYPQNYQQGGQPYPPTGFFQPFPEGPAANFSQSPQNMVGGTPPNVSQGGEMEQGINAPQQGYNNQEEIKNSIDEKTLEQETEKVEKVEKPEPKKELPKKVEPEVETKEEEEFLTEEEYEKEVKPARKTRKKNTESSKISPKKDMSNLLSAFGGGK